MKELYTKLEELNIKYDKLEHHAVYTVEEAQSLVGKIKGTGCKNLFLKDKKKNYYLYVLKENKMADLKALGAEIGAKNFRFCSEDVLWDVLKLTKGSCTPMGIINDTENLVTVIIDKDFVGRDRLLVHPNRNTATISISYDDLVRFIENENHKYIIF